MLFSRILGCCTMFMYFGVTVSVARTTGLSVPSNSSARGDNHSHGWSRGRSGRRKKSERRPTKHRHSTRVDRNRPPIVLLPPWTDDKLPVTTTTTTAAPSPPFIINVPYDIQNNTEFDVQVPADYLSPPLVDVISQFQLAPDPDPVVTSESPGTSTSSLEYASTVPSTRVTLSLVVDSNDRVALNDNYTSETPSHSLELTYYTFTPKEDRNIQKTTTVIPENDLSPPLIASESGDVRNFRFRQFHRANEVSSNSEHETLRKKDQKQHKHARHACTRKGYIADVSSGCQVFHICVDNGVGESMSCPNGTLFNQEFSVCDWWYNVECK